MCTVLWHVADVRPANVLPFASFVCPTACLCFTACLCLLPASCKSVVFVCFLCAGLANVTHFLHHGPVVCVARELHIALCQVPCG